MVQGKQPWACARRTPHPRSSSFNCPRWQAHSATNETAPGPHGSQAMRSLARVDVSNFELEAQKQQASTLKPALWTCGTMLAIFSTPCKGTLLGECCIATARELAFPISWGCPTADSRRTSDESAEALLREPPVVAAAGGLR